MKFKMEKLQNLVSSIEKQSSHIPKTNATTPPPINQVAIIMWKKKNNETLATIWDYVYNLIFFHVKAYNTTNEAWIVLKNTYSASEIIIEAYLQEKFITQK